MKENTNCDVSIQDAKILCDMGYIFNEEAGLSSNVLS